MATTSFTALRRLAGFASSLLLLSFCLTGAAIGQSPLVTASAPVGLNHPTGWKAIQQTQIDANGDWLVEEFPDGGLFEFPANSSPNCSVSGGPSCVNTLVPLTGLGSNNGYQNPLLLVDPGNNVYVGGNWNNCMLEFPYDSATDSWPKLSMLTPTNPSPDECGTYPPTIAQYSIFGFSPYYFQPWGVALGNSNTGPATGNIIVGNQNSGNWIFDMAIQGAWSNPTVTQSSSSTFEILSAMTARPISLAVDPEGDIFFVEDSSQKAFLPGVYEIPQSIVAAGEAAGTAGVTETDTSTGIVRVDPSLPDVTGVVTDAAGNLYISDGDDGVFFVPNSNGTINTSAAVMLTPVPAQGEVAIDPARKILYVPTTEAQNNGQADVAEARIGYAEFGSSAVGKATSALPIDFSFNGSVTPASFVIVQDAMTTPEFSITGGTCATGTAYGPLSSTSGAPPSSCDETVTYTPAAVGNSTAKLLMLDAKGNILASMELHGTGVGAIGQASAGVESKIGTTLKTPAQVAVDAAGNVYVADPGSKEVVEFAAGSSTAVPISTGTVTLVSPTGVAVDGAGDVFIADSGASGGGAVYEVPLGPSGLEASGTLTLVSGLGSNLSLAVDGLGDLYIADPSNGRVVRMAGIGATSAGALTQSTTYLTTGATSPAPSAVAVDSNNNLYVIDSGNLYEFTGGLGTPTNLLGLSSVVSGQPTGLAVDPSGAVYISSTSGTVRVPYVNGALNATDVTTVAPDVTATSSVALDRWDNVYVTPPAGPGITVVSTTGTVNLGTAGSSAAPSNTADVMVTNAGNAPLTITGYTSSTVNDNGVPVANFTGADGTCMGDSPIAAGSSCVVAVTFEPGAGQQGTLTGTVTPTSNALTPVTIDAAGTGAALTASTASISIGSTAQVIDTPVSVTVSSSGGPAPTGSVQVTFTSWTVTSGTCSWSIGNAKGTGPCGQINPVPQTAMATLTPSSSGSTSTATFNLAPVLAEPQVITVGYTGDRTYGQSTASSPSITVAKSPVTFAGDPNPPPYLPYVEMGNPPSGVVPYDGSQANWQYTLPVTVVTAAGIPTGNVIFYDNSQTCPPGTSTDGLGTAYCLPAAVGGTTGSPSALACLEAPGTSVQYVVNNGNPSTDRGASVGFNSTCLQYNEYATFSPVMATHYITPVYSGDTNFLGGTDTPVLFQALRGPLVNITTTMPSVPASGPVYGPISPTTLTVQPGSTASVTLYVTPLLGYGFQGKGALLNNYDFPVSLECDNLPPHATCSFTYPTNNISAYQPSAPNSMQICPEPDLDSNTLTASAYEKLAESGGCNQNGIGIATLTLNTNVNVGTTTTTSQNTAVPMALASIFGLGMFGLFFRRKAFEKGRRVLMVLLMIVGGALAFSLMACNTTNLTPNSVLSTPPGTYDMDVTAVQVGTQCVPASGVQQLPCTTATGQSGETVNGSENQVSYPFYLKVDVQ
jgi:sugar lactone lactonase YvrE